MSPATVRASAPGTPSVSNTLTRKASRSAAAMVAAATSDIATRDAVPVPEHEAALQPDHQGEEREADQAQVEDQREHPRRIELRGGDANQLAEALAAAEELAGDGAGHDAHRADLEAGEEMRQPGRQLHLPQRLPAARPHGLEQHARVLVGGMDARGGADHDGEGGDEGGERH